MVLKVLTEQAPCVTCTRRALLRGLGIGIAVAGTFVGCGGSSGGGIDAGSGHPDASAGHDAAAACPTNDMCLDLTMSKYAALKNVGGSVIVQTPSDTLIVVRTSNTTVAALSAICTHQGCQVVYQSSSMLLYCPCHGAEFSLTGAVVRGPAATPVKKYTAMVSGNTIEIVLA